MSSFPTMLFVSKIDIFSCPQSTVSVGKVITLLGSVKRTRNFDLLLERLILSVRRSCVVGTNEVSLRSSVIAAVTLGIHRRLTSTC